LAIFSDIGIKGKGHQIIYFLKLLDGNRSFQTTGRGGFKKFRGINSFFLGGERPRLGPTWKKERKEPKRRKIGF
jgi:hypothetical protein